MKGRRKLILDGLQGTPRGTHSTRAPETSGESCDNAATEQQRKCTPTVVAEQHASNTQFRRPETRLMRRKQNQNKTGISGQEGDAAGQNTTSSDQQAPPAFEKHVDATSTKTPAGKGIRTGIPESKVTRGVRTRTNAAQRKLARSEACATGDCGNALVQNGTQEADSTELGFARNKESTGRQKPPQTGAQCALNMARCKQPKATARAGPSGSRPLGSESSHVDSKPAAGRTKALPVSAVGRPARNRHRRADAPTVATPDNKVACDDMYQCEGLSIRAIPDHIFQRLERLSDIVIPRSVTPPLNSPHFSPGRAQNKRGVKSYRVLRQRT